jgi:hypothetical protein
MKKFLPSPPAVAVLVFLTIGIGGWAMSLPLVNFVRTFHTERIARELAAATTEWEKEPPNRERAGKYLKTIWAIDPGYAYADVREALHAFVTAMTLVMTWDGTTDKSKEKVIQDAEVAGQNLKDAFRRHL